MELTYRKITKENFYDVVALHRTLTPNQKKCVATNEYSIAEGLMHPDNAYFRAIYLEEKPIGFFMVFIPTEQSIKEGENEFFLWRFMITKDHQHKHFGTKVLDHICQLAVEKGYEEITTSCETWEESPYPFYIKYGFKENGKKYGYETGLVFKLKKD